MVKLFGVLAAVVLAAAAQACPPVGYTASAYSSCNRAYGYAAPTYYQTQAVLAYPLTLLAVPAVTVPVQPAAPPVQEVPKLAPPPVPEQPQVQLPAPTAIQAPIVQSYPTVVTRQVYANFAVPSYGACGVCANTVAYGAVGYGAACRVVVHRAVHRAGFFQRFRERRAERLAVRANRAQKRAFR